MLRKRAASCGPTGGSTGYSDSTRLIGVGWIDIESSITFSCEHCYPTMLCPRELVEPTLKASHTASRFVLTAPGAHLGVVFEKNSPLTTLLTYPLSKPTVEEPELYSDRACRSASCPSPRTAAARWYSAVNTRAPARRLVQGSKSSSTVSPKSLACCVLI